jgi:hypothetical protein
MNGKYSINFIHKMDVFILLQGTSWSHYRIKYPSG